MGYYMSQRDNSFFLPKEKQQEALQAIKIAAESKPRIFGACTSQFQTLQEALESWCWKPQFDKKGNIEAISFEGQKSGYELELFQAIAPFVKAGSFIEMSGEDGAIWRYQFDGTICFENYPKIIWD
jgi:hypothetical protein